MRRAFLAVLALIVTAGLALGSTQQVSAHEHREILGGKYEVVVGFLNEPAISGEVNGLSLDVMDLTQATPDAETGEDVPAPVIGLEETLTVDIIFVDQTKTLELEPRFREPGSYNAYVIPVQAGDYAFHIYGTINGEAVDETFTPGPETFSQVLDRATYEFPAASASAENALAFGITTGSGGIGRDDIGGGLFAGALGLIAIAGGSQILRRRTALPPTAVHASSAGD
jgi:hypothetical protein